MAYVYYHSYYQMYVHIGDESDDVITGTDTTDYIITYGGDDKIASGDGDDIIYSGSGGDLIDSGAGDDYIDAGTGEDTVIVEGSILSYTINGTVSDFSRSVQVVQASGTDRIVNAEALSFDDYTLYLDGRNNAALALDDEVDALDGDVTVIDVEALLANDRDFDGDTLNILSVSAVSSEGAAIVLNNGEITYDPDALFAELSAGEIGTDTITYTVGDGNGGSATGTVTINVEGVNDAPELNEAAFAVDENAALGTVVGQVTGADVEGDALQSFEFTGGNFDLDGDGILAFAIDEVGEITVADSDDLDFETLPAFSLGVTASDGTDTSEVAQVSVAVNDIVEGPYARINEFHYDNVGRDRDEFVELRVEAGEDFSGLAIELYNGANNSLYRRFEIDDAVQVADDGDADYDYFVFELRPNHIQNGYKDGIALVDGDDLLEFISYEGTLTAANGIAAGETSADIGTQETIYTAHGTSIHRSEDGSEWYAGLSESAGFANSFEFV